MSETLYAGQVAIDDLPKLIAACQFSPEARVLIERLPAHVIIRPKERQDLLRFTYFDREIPFTDYTSGRIFQKDTELHWERQGNNMRVVYLGSEENVPALRDYKLDKSDEWDKLKPEDEPKYYYLFGQRISPDDLKKIGPLAKPGDFAEVRIPRLLHYPVDDDPTPYVRLAVQEYVDIKTGRTALFRFQGLEPMEVKR